MVQYICYVRVHYINFNIRLGRSGSLNNWPGLEHVQILGVGGVTLINLILNRLNIHSCEKSPKTPALSVFKLWQKIQY